MDVLLTAGYSILLFAIPGILLFPLLLPLKIGRTASLGIGIALLTMLYTWLASLWRYHWASQLALTLALDGLLLLAIWRKTPRASFSQVLLSLYRTWQLPLQSWQWGVGIAVIIAYFAPALFLPVPMDVDAQGFGFLTLTVRESGSIFSLAPYYPHIGWFYSPAYFLFTAFLSDISQQTITASMFGFSHLLALGLIAGIGSLGRRMAGESGGWWAGIAAAAGVAIFTTMLDSAYTSLLGIWNSVTFLYCLELVWRAPRQKPALWLAGMALGSVLLAHPDSIIQLLIAYIPFYLTCWLVRPRPTTRQFLALGVLLPLIGVGLCLPWLARSLWLVPQLAVHERQNPQIGWLGWLYVINGIWTVWFAGLGVWWALRKRHWLDIWNITWMLAIVEFAALGNLDSLSRQTSIDPMQVFYPFGMAWHAPIVPLPLLAMRALQPLGAWLAPRLGWQSWRTPVTWALAALAALAMLAHKPLINLLRRDVRPVVGSVATPADLRAYAWIRANTDPTARLLNYPGVYEGQWAPVLAERDAVFTREQLFFTNAAQLFQEWEELDNAYLDPLNPNSHRQICAVGVDYLVVPQLLSQPQVFSSLYRLRPPDILPQQSQFPQADYLKLLVDFDGAQVWQVECP